MRKRVRSILNSCLGKPQRMSLFNTRFQTLPERVFIPGITAITGSAKRILDWVLRHIRMTERAVNGMYVILINTYAVLGKAGLISSVKNWDQTLFITNT